MSSNSTFCPAAPSLFSCACVGSHLQRPSITPNERGCKRPVIPLTSSASFSLFSETRTHKHARRWCSHACAHVLAFTGIMICNAIGSAWWRWTFRLEVKILRDRQMSQNKAMAVTEKSSKNMFLISLLNMFNVINVVLFHSLTWSFILYQLVPDLKLYDAYTWWQTQTPHGFSTAEPRHQKEIFKLNISQRIWHSIYTRIWKSLALSWNSK